MTLLQPRLPLKEKMFFAEHLAVMLKAGIALDRALSTLEAQTNKKSSKKIFSALEETVRQGQPLSEGLKPFEYTFGSLFINMIAAGEFSGKMEESLRRLHTQMKKDYDLRSKVIGALTYPAFVIVAMIGIGMAMMMFVIPKLAPVFAEFNTQLPLPTRILLTISAFLAHYTLWVILLAMAAAAVFVKLIRGPARRVWHSFLLRLPLLGPLMRNVNVARATRTLSTLLGTDILVVRAFEISSQVLGNALFKDALSKCAEEIKRGVSIASILKKYPRLFPATVETMVTIGEQSGTLKELLEEVAQFYEEQVDATTRNLSSIIEPVLIVLLGAAVGGIAIAILTPMYALMDQI